MSFTPSSLSKVVLCKSDESSMRGKRAVTVVHLPRDLTETSMGSDAFSENTAKSTLLFERTSGRHFPKLFEFLIEELSSVLVRNRSPIHLQKALRQEFWVRRRFVVTHIFHFDFFVLFIF